MDWMMSPVQSVQDFMVMGGDVLKVIAIAIFLMWLLIFERLIFFRTTLKAMQKEIHDQWEARPERKSWNAKQIRQAMISRFAIAARTGLPIIQTLVALCPLLGLMGTVTGMIAVFDVMALSGTGNARSMASGVSLATVPTMAGMIGALSGVFLVTMITRAIETRVEDLQDHLTMDH
jgi:biopolymer transport protein ExbB